MLEKNPFEIPYSLETLQDVVEAMNNNFLHIGKDGYTDMLFLAKKVAEQKIPFEKPSVLQKARAVTKDFYVLKEEKIRQYNITYSEVAGLDVIDKFNLIEKRIPWAGAIAKHDNFFTYLKSFPKDIKDICQADHPTSPLTAFNFNTSLSKLIRQELLSFVLRKQTNHFTPNELKQLLVAYVFFEPGNNDILQALRMSNGLEQHLYQNALAELLFSRISKFMDRFIAVDTSMVKEKLFTKIASLNLSARQKMNLYGYFKSNIKELDINPTLDKINSIIKNTSIPDEAKKKLHHYIMSLKHNIEAVHSLYKEWFLTKELVIMQKLHIPRNVIKAKTTYTDNIISTYANVATLRFFPTKDFLDLCRWKASADCTKEGKLSEKQLLTSYFFNVRIFDSEWIGNIYMLDFIKECGALVVDRIQIPRDIKAIFINFFQYLKEVLEEMFVDANFKYILLPLKISNNETIQRVFNSYRKKLPRKEIPVPKWYAAYFESLDQGTSFYILSQKG